MSSKKEIVDNYRKNKKINKAKIKNDRFNRERSIMDENNSLPSGMFDKNLSVDDLLLDKDRLKRNKSINNIDEENNSEEEQKDIIVDDEFTDDYFEPVVYNPTKK